MALTLQALGLEAKDQGVSESAWIVQIAGTIIFQKKIHSWKTPIMRSVPFLWYKTLKAQHLMWYSILDWDTPKS